MGNKTQCPHLCFIHGLSVDVAPESGTRNYTNDNDWDPFENFEIMPTQSSPCKFWLDWSAVEFNASILFKFYCIHLKDTKAETELFHFWFTPQIPRAQHRLPMWQVFDLLGPSPAASQGVHCQEARITSGAWIQTEVIWWRAQGVPSCILTTVSNTCLNQTFENIP